MLQFAQLLPHSLPELTSHQSMHNVSPASGPLMTPPQTPDSPLFRDRSAHVLRDVNGQSSPSACPGPSRRLKSEASDDVWNLLLLLAVTDLLSFQDDEPSERATERAKRSRSGSFLLTECPAVAVVCARV